MLAKKLYLKNYRSINEASMEFQDNVNILIGQNGQGKTNILEAIYYFACQKSFRGAKMRELVGWGKDFFELTLDFSSDGRDMHALSRVKSSGTRENYLNGVKKRRAADMIGSFSAVIFAPEHMSMVKDGPSVRRSVIDFALCQTDEEYFLALAKYKKVLEQKNTYLRNSGGRADINMLAVWNEQLASPAAKIAQSRAEFIKSLSDAAALRQSDISGGSEALELVYSPSIEKYADADEVYSSFMNKANAEAAAGMSLIGTHRDDMDIFINGRAAKTFASQGQQRSCVLSVKLAECELFKSRHGEYPVLLLDDILSELDNRRQSYIIEAIKDRQIFLSCCDEESIKAIENGRRFYISGGEVSKIIENV